LLSLSSDIRTRSTFSLLQVRYHISRPNKENYEYIYIYRFSANNNYILESQF
jgi:hypothetical protein